MKKIRVYLIFSAIFGFLPVCFAQVDTTYIEPYNQKITVKAYLSKNFIEIQKDDKNYMPNNPMKLGVGLSVRNTVVNLGYSFGLNFTTNPKWGKTESFDFQLHNYGRNFLFDISYQSYKGFYYQSDDNRLGRENTAVELYSDLKVAQIGAEATYLFNGKRFSAKSAFAQSEKQLKSAGSFALGGGIYRNHIEWEESLFAATEKDAINNLQFGVKLGYAYSYVINKNWMLSGMVTAGVHLGNEQSRLKKGKIEVSPAVFSRMAIGYNKPDWAASFSFLEHLNSFTFSDAKPITLNSIDFQISYVKYLDWSPFWKK
jgi:hypothetical protein